jgi:hypothetical protein
VVERLARRAPLCPTPALAPTTITPDDSAPSTQASSPTFDAMPAVGELVRCTDDQWMVRPPQHCPSGHKLAPGWVLVGHSGVIPPDHSPHSGARHMSITSGSPSP